MPTTRNDHPATSSPRRFRQLQNLSVPDNFDDRRPDAEITAWESHSPSQAPGASVEPIEACAVGLPGGHQDHRRSELLQPLCHCAVAARSDLRESGTATMSALNLWNKNTERVSDALSRDSYPALYSTAGQCISPLPVKPHI